MPTRPNESVEPGRRVVRIAADRTIESTYPDADSIHMVKGMKLRLVMVVGVAIATLLSGCAGAGAPQASASGVEYTLRPGDSFYRVAAKFDVDPVELASANGLSLSSMLHPGDVLTIPGGSSASGTPTTVRRARSATTTTAQSKSAGNDAGTVSVSNGASSNGVGRYPMTNAQRSEIVRLAKSKMNSTYVWGAVGPNRFDCSGFAYWLYNQVDVKIPRLTSSMYAARSTTVAEKDLLPGDLVFFHTPVSHMGIYIGDGMMAEAASSDLDMRISSVHRASLVKFGRL